MSIVQLILVIALGVGALVANNRYNGEPITRTIINVVVVLVFLVLFLREAGLVTV